MRSTRRVRATIQRVPFQGQPGKYLPGPTKTVDPETGEVAVVPGQPMTVPWSAYWRTRLEQGLVEIVEPTPVEPTPAEPFTVRASATSLKPETGEE